tara:strand:+ start:573 stop:1325 length:753 start_codon:yes stop_codon:yes gene_type:complete
MPSNFLPALGKLKDAVTNLIKNDVDLEKQLDESKSLYDFKTKQKIYHFDHYKKILKEVKDHSLKLTSLVSIPDNESIVNNIMHLLPDLEAKKTENVHKTIEKLENLSKQLDYPQKNISFSKPETIPDEIKSDLSADMEELQKCFSNRCFRSAVILCGRIMESALHWKYYNATGFDLLEKSPGIGLGNIIAKLREKNVEVDPAITQQIHLINQVRVFSVHKKQEAFNPSEEQTHAIVLYTTDILNKLFAKQ